MNVLAGKMLLALAAASSATFLSPAAKAAPRACDGTAPATQAASIGRRLDALDLLRLRDIGYMHPGPGQRLLAVSPDRRSVAFVMHRADPVTNRYCVALVVADVEGLHPAHILDSGDDIILESVAIRGVEVDYGLPRIIVPQWSPDGRRIAYLKKDKGIAQVFLVELASGAARQVSQSVAGVDHFAWSRDGKSILYSDRPDRLRVRDEIEAEGAAGYLVDDRVLPYNGTTPAVRTPLAEQHHAYLLDDDHVRASTDEEEASLAAAKAAEGSDGAISAHFASGWSISKVQAAPGSYASPTQLVATDPAGRHVSCDHPTCRADLFFDIEGAWETDRPGEFAYLRREGWGGSMMGLYLWRPGTPPRALLSTEDLLVGCESLGARLICARESSLRPRRLVTLDLRDNGRERPIFNPNPEFDTISLGAVHRLRWRNARGQESYSDLVLPPHPGRDAKVPLVIVQYVTRGFLRGGTGDEYPIQLLAGNGFAVLSFQKPSPLFAAEGNDGSMEAVLTRLNADWDDRRNIHSSLIGGVDAALRQARIDRTRIGISGVSDGSTTVQFGLINSPGLFKAASIGSCCVDPTSMMIYGGVGLAREREKWGYPAPSGTGSEAWKPLSLPMNTADKMAPLLMQLADSEFLISMETLAAYERNRRPVEARIFPQEFHLKVQPRHRLALYCRNLNWFAFWLDQPQVEPSCPVDAAEQKRWSLMRESAGRNGPS